MNIPAAASNQGPPAAPAELSDAALGQALEHASVPTLLMVLVHLTGDRRWLGDRYRPARPRGLSDDDTGGLDAEVQQEIRNAARDTLRKHLAQGCPAPAAPAPDELAHMLSFSVGEQVPDEYGAMMAADLTSLLRPTPASVPAVDHELSVLIVGSGPSGLATAVRLREAGIPYTIVERNAEVGGTWLVNEYPGAAVDTPTDIYSFSFAPFPWSRYFSPGTELRTYLAELADRYGIRDHARFGTEAKAARWDEDAQVWHLDVEDLEGSRETLTAPILVSAVGALSSPSIPDLPGLAGFIGPSFHSARWPRGFDIRGKRVAVIGTGATAMQLVPAIVDDAEHVTIFQRSPQWAAPFEKFHVEIPAPLRELMMAVPVYRAWYRLRQAWIFNDKVYDSLVRDPDWPHPERSVNEINDAHRRFFTRYIREQLGDREDLLDKSLPTYPPFLKRMLLDNGWFAAIKRDDVTLATDEIHEVLSDRIVTESGDEHRADVLVLATGFDATHFLSTLTVTGRGGVSLTDLWQGDDAKAYLGMVVPQFPNFFTLYGPNLQTGHGGSFMYLAECQLRYIMDLVSLMIEHGLTSVECKPDVYEDYNRAVDAQHERLVWSHHGATTYYRNSRGRVVVNSPWRVVDFWRMTQHADLGDYTTRRAELTQPA